MKHGNLKKLMVALLLLVAVCASAQPDSLHNLKRVRDKPVFRALINTGLLPGDSGRDVQLQATTGLQYQNWMVGIGAGIDYYYLRTVPVFLEVRKRFQMPMPLFLYAGGGRNVPWAKKEKDQTWYASDFKSGWYYDVGAGWHVALKKNHAILLSAGYSGKRLSEVQTVPQGGLTTYLNYNLRRLSIKVGFQL